MKKSMIEQCPSLKDCQILSDEMMDGIESGACKEACKKTCVTDMNGTLKDGGTQETVKELVGKTIDSATEILK